MDWKPMNTIPLNDLKSDNGRRILAYFPTDGVCTVKWGWGGWQLDPDGGTEFSYEFSESPTHWAELPAPPAGGRVK
jgi:hypothetical protein